MRGLIFTLILFLSAQSIAFESVVSEPDDNAYNYVSHYRIEIEAQPQTVWKHLKNLGSWMVDFEMSHVSGTEGAVGEVLRLYPQQDFFCQITALVPNELLVIANLPVTFKGEFSTGAGIITLNETKNGAVVDVTMSRRYTWEGEGSNPMKGMRESADFQQGSQATWNKFLEKLRSLSEMK